MPTNNDYIPTIYDVAREAGVARATVPNASRLASKKKLTIACLIPQFDEGEYWAVAYQGFIEGAKSIKSYDVDTDIYLFDPDDINSFHTISLLVSSIIGENTPHLRDNYMHMDILHKLNSKHYDFIG